MRFPVNTDRRTILTRKYTLICSLLFICGSLLSFISSANAQACTPVVYAFRHAEDFGTNLTLVGRQHADLYPAMVASFEAAHNYCPVAYVYSMYQTNPDGRPGTNNPFETAEPLANVACYNLAFYTNNSPSITCSSKSDFEPITALLDGGKLYEYLRATEAEAKAGYSATATQLLDELKKRARAGGGLSSAIFWSSQGLNVLGQAIVLGFTGIPGCSVPPSPGCAELKAPRNAAYVFVFNGSAFEAPDDITQYVQCFDVQIKKFCIPGTPHPTPPTLEGPPTVATGETRYWCGNGVDGTGNLPATSDLTPKCEQTLPSTFNNLDLLQGKICDTSKLIATGPRGYYGYCQ